MHTVSSQSPKIGEAAIAKEGLFAPNFKMFLTSSQKVTGAIASVDLCQQGP